MTDGLLSWLLLHPYLLFTLSFFLLIFIFGYAGSLLLPAGFSLIAASGGTLYPTLGGVYSLLISVASLVPEHGL